MTEKEKILELEERVKNLEDTIKDLKEIIYTLGDSGPKCFSIRNDDRDNNYKFDHACFKSDKHKDKLSLRLATTIYNIFEDAIDACEPYIIINAGEIHNYMELTSRIPSVCNAMRSAANCKEYVKSFEVIRDTPSHNSSTYTIKYYLNERSF